MSKTVNEVNMEKDLVRGKKGETFLLKFMSSNFSSTGTKRNDLVNAETGVKVEVKTESYTHKRMGIEQYSSKESKYTGGPYKAQRDGCKYIAHVFPSTNKVVIFDTEKLLAALGTPESLPNKFNELFDCIPFNKKNWFDALGQKLDKPYTTTGYAVPLTFFPQDSYIILDLKDGLMLDEYLK